MRYLKNISALLFLTAAIGVAHSQELVAMDERPGTDFERYETYSWTENVVNADAGAYLNNRVLKSTIQDAIEYELEARGYENKDNNADMLINFRVFEEPTEFQGYVDSDLDEGEFIEAEDAKTYQLEAGTLLIQLMDKEEGTVVWQGFASGIMDGEVFDKSPERIKEAVHEIFDKYEYSAD